MCIQMLGLKVKWASLLCRIRKKKGGLKTKGECVCVCAISLVFNGCEPRCSFRGDLS